MSKAIEKNLTCEEVSRTLDAFVSARLDPAMRGRAQAHILFCKRCEEEYAAHIHTGVDSGDLVVEIPTPRIPEFLSTRLKHEVLGTIWNTELAQRQLTVLLATLVAAIQNRRAVRTRGVVRTRGKVSDSASIEAEVLDKAYRPLNKRIEFKIEKKPKVTDEGEFVAQFSTVNVEYEGCTLAFTLEFPSGEKSSILEKLQANPERTQLVAEITKKGINVNAVHFPSGFWRLYILAE